jgi:hypothetical protein
MSSSRPLDFFDKARSVAASTLFACGLAAILGSIHDWVTIEPPEVVPAAESARLQPFNGLDATDGWFVLAGGVILIGAAALLVLRAKTGYAWIAFFSAMVIGAIAVADFRGMDELFYEQMDRIGDPMPGIGLILVAVAGILGVIAAAGAVAATPRREE